MISDNIDLQNNIFSTLTLAYNKLLNVSGLGANIASLAEYITGSGTITLPTNFTHILIIMGGGGGGGGGSDGTGYASGGGGAGAFVLGMRSKAELVGTSLSYSIGVGGAGGTAGNPGSDGSSTTLSGSGVNLTAGGGHGGHRGTSARGGNTGAGGTPITQTTSDIGITGANGGSYNSGYPTQTSYTFFGMGQGGINGPDSGAGSYDGVAGNPEWSSTYFLQALNGSCSGGGGVGGYRNFPGGRGGSGFLKIYYFYN